jgi:hypothetical protein
MSFSTINKKMRNREKVLIIARSPNREDFIKPQRVISNLFTPKLLKLEFSEFNFLDKMQSGQLILEDI